MARYVIDAPTLLRIVDSALVVDPGYHLVAPNSIRSEALQLLLDDVLRGERTDRAALATHERITEIRIRLLGDRASRGLAWRIAREHGSVTIHAAQYLAICRLQGDALVTVDPDLAALAQGVVPVAALEDLFAPRTPLSP